MKMVAMVFLSLALGACALQQTAPRTKPARVKFDPAQGCPPNDKKCAALKADYYEAACNRGNMDGCYNYGLARQERGDDEWLVAQAFDQVCDARDERGCKALADMKIKSCVDRTAAYKNQSQCYQMVKEETPGISITRPVRIHNEFCDALLKSAEDKCLKESKQTDR